MSTSPESGMLIEKSCARDRAENFNTGRAYKICTLYVKSFMSY